MAKLTSYATVTTIKEGMFFYTAIDTDDDGSYESRKVAWSSLRASLQPADGHYPIYLDAAPQVLSGPGAVNITSPVTNFTSTGATDALTLADHTIVGTMKVLNHVVDGGGYVLTPATMAGGSTITVTDPGVSIALMWTTAGWRLVSQTGAATIA